MRKYPPETSDWPSGSLSASANVWRDPLPEDGVTETTLGLWSAPTVHVPVDTQPLAFDEKSSAHVLVC